MGVKDKRITELENAIEIHREQFQGEPMQGERNLWDVLDKDEHRLRVSTRLAVKASNISGMLSEVLDELEDSRDECLRRAVVLAEDIERRMGETDDLQTTFRLIAELVIKRHADDWNSESQSTRVAHTSFASYLYHYVGWDIVQGEPGARLLCERMDINPDSGEHAQERKREAEE